MNVIVIACWLGLVSIATPPQTVFPQTPATDGKGQQPVSRPDRRNESMCGQVTAIREGSLTLVGIEAEFRGVSTYVAGPERGQTTFSGNPISLVTPTKTVKGAKIIRTNNAFTVIDDSGHAVTLYDKDQPSRTFKIAPELAKSVERKGVLPSDAYGLQDIKVGDYITIRYDRVKGTEYCTTMRIDRRPGGLVPPSPFEKIDGQLFRYHELQNAYNEWVDHGTPIPDKFLSPWELEERRSKTAPLPHAAVPRTPQAKP
jgi:hypothetical protein